MASTQFDFITTKAFRTSIESDYAELQRNLDVRSWKSVLVLAGSIVESVLVDHIATTTNPSRATKDPLRLELAEAIQICRSEDILSHRTADLCSVVRSYRNLIHPGRVVRLGEPQPDAATANIAVQLVDIIAGEVAAKRRAAMGPTAEQLMSKLLRDSKAITVIRHLLGEVVDLQKERFLLELLPEAFFAMSSEPFDPDFDQELGVRLTSAYRVVLQASSIDIQKRVAEAFVKILREEDGVKVIAFSRAFFACEDAAHLSEQDRALVLAHLLERSGSPFTSVEDINLMSGITALLTPTTVHKWVDPLAKSALYGDPGLLGPLAKHVAQECRTTEVAFDRAAGSRFELWIDMPGRTPAGKELLKRLMEAVPADVPF